MELYSLYFVAVITAADVDVVNLIGIFADRGSIASSKQIAIHAITIHVIAIVNVADNLTNKWSSNTDSIFTYVAPAFIQKLANDNTI